MIFTGYTDAGAIVSPSISVSQLPEPWRNSILFPAVPTTENSVIIKE